MGILLLLLSYPSFTGPTGNFDILSAKNLPMANLSFFLDLQYSRKHYPARFDSTTQENVPIDHHYGVFRGGFAYGIIDYLETYIGGTGYFKYEERKELGAYHHGDIGMVGFRDLFGGAKIAIPVLNDTTKFPLVLFLGLHGGGNVTFERTSDDDKLVLEGCFNPTLTHRADYFGDFLMTFELYPMAFTLDIGYIRRGERNPLNSGDSTIDNFFNDNRSQSNSAIYGGAFELNAGPYTKLTLGLKGSYHLLDKNLPDTAFGFFGVRFITPVGVTFDFSGDYLINDVNFLPDYRVVNGTPEIYTNDSGKWRLNFGFTTTSALIQKKKPAPKPKPKPIGVLALDVKDAETELPLMVNIVFEDTIMKTLQTDSNGHVDMKLEPGTYTFKIVKDGYKSKRITVTITGNTRIQREITLKKIHIPMGIFTGTVTDARTKKPVGAKITFLGSDQKPIASDLETGIFKAKLPAGTYNVKIEADGYVPETRVVNIKDGETTIINFGLYEKLKEKQTIVIHNIHFASGKATITPDSYPILDQIVQLLKANPNVKIEIAGHTDSVGSEMYNLRLSEARANAVRDYLIQHGISADRLIARGYGESRPIAPNTTREGRAKNRRVEFTVLSQ